MRIIEGKEIVPPKSIIEEKERSGKIECSCNKVFIYSVDEEINVGEMYGYIVPICPDCETIPESKTRRMDL